MQINSQPPIRPIPARRKQGGKLDPSKNVTNFENQVQAANQNLKRQQQGEADKAPADDQQQGGIDVTA